MCLSLLCIFVIAISGCQKSFTTATALQDNLTLTTLRLPIEQERPIRQNGFEVDAPFEVTDEELAEFMEGLENSNATRTTVPIPNRNTILLNSSSYPRARRSFDSDEAGMLPLAEDSDVYALGFSDVYGGDAGDDGANVRGRYSALPCTAEASGLLKFTDADSGNPSKCTAAYYGHPKILITAAHCVYGRRGWHSDFVFYQAAENGRGIARRAYQSFVKNAWHGWRRPGDGGAPTNWKFDYAFIVMQDESANGCVLSGAGNIGPGNLRTSHTFWSNGYPRNFGDGKQFKVATISEVDLTPNSIRLLGNPMGKGISGGVVQSAAYIRGELHQQLVVGVNSMGHTGRRLVYSPMMDANAQNLYEEALEVARGQDSHVYERTQIRIRIHWNE